ncbi:MAG: hypothetical protein K2X49_14310 [Acetobacteraceae bacterium]|nr:hypothetical protein [Acetobacteraceae bacterium]
MLLGMRRPVPARGEGRRAGHREHFAIVELLIFLHQACPAAFPLTVEKGEAPDFLLRPARSNRTSAVEHTETTVEADQHFEAKADGATSFAWSPGGGGWTGSQIIAHLEEALLLALRRKAADSRWRNAPADASRMVPMYDASGVELHADDVQAAQALRGAFWAANQETPALRQAFLVRGMDRVIAAKAYA